MQTVRKRKKMEHLWNKLYIEASRTPKIDASKFADSAIRMRQRSLELDAKRPKIILINHEPETQVQETTAVLKCKARTLVGKQCGFKATCGGFCKKHKAAPKNF